MKCKGMGAKKINEIVKEHLVEVKNQEDLMGYESTDIKLKSEPVEFRGNYYKHIFSDKLAKEYKNVGTKRWIVPYVYLEPYRKDIINHIFKADINLHIYYRNFNSSQGVVLNFLGPIINTSYERKFSEHVFGIENGKFKIEHQMDDKGSHSKNSSEIDFTITDGESLYLFEAKYTEQGFGRASISKEAKKYDTDKYKDKWFGSNDSKKINHGRTSVKYNQLVCDGILKDIPFDNESNESKENKETFIKNYQLIRNLYNTVYFYEDNCIKKRDAIGKMHVVVLEDNLTHCREFGRFSDLVIDHKIVNGCSYLTWQTLCEKAILFASNNNDEKLEHHYNLFKQVFLDYEK